MKIEGQLETPIAIVVFNRLDTTMKLLDSIKKYARPKKLYVISDAAREHVEGEAEKVQQIRDYIEKAVDWPCEVYKNYAKKNMGCDARSVSGYNWFFSMEEEGICLEDDCIPCESFYPFCERMLKEYRYDERVMVITGLNHIQDDYSAGEDYYFSWFPKLWGWATWARAWRLYDDKVSTWPEFRKSGFMKQMFTKPAYQYYYWHFTASYEGFEPWDGKWDFARWYNMGLGIVPQNNMITNIGAGRPDATHPAPIVSGGSAFMQTTEYTQDISIRKNVTWDRQFDIASQKKSYKKSRYGWFIKEGIKEWMKKHFKEQSVNFFKKIYHFVKK